MKKRKILIKVYAFILTIFIFLISWNSRERRLIAEGNLLIRKIENFKNSNNRLPRNSNEVGIIEKEDDELHYVFIDSNRYIVFYGEGVGESVTYHSETKVG